MPRAKNKIYYNIGESDYMQNVNDLKFYFSKIQYLEKFNELLMQNRIEMKQRLKYLYGVEIGCEEWCDIRLYLIIEKNGFRVYKGGEQLWLNNLILDGEVVTLKR